jgi:hypothetical protein
VKNVGLHGAETSRAVPVPTLAKAYEDRAEDCTRAAEQTDDPVFRKMQEGIPCLRSWLAT